MIKGFNNCNSDVRRICMVELSIIIPVYNCNKYINCCLNSIIKCVGKKIEIILIDDGSADGSAEICDEYARQYSFIRVMHQVNQGVSKARNSGIEMAYGKYLMFVDSDDFIDVDELRYFLCEINNDYDCVAAGIRYYYESDGHIDEYPLKRMEINYPYSINECFDVLNKNRFFSAIYSKIYKKRIIDEHKLKFPVEFSIWEDSAFVYEYLSYCNKILCVEYIFYNYRQTLGESLVKRINKNSVDALLYRYNKSKYLCDYLNQKNRSAFYSTLGYWLIVSLIQPYLYNKNMCSMERLIHYMKNSDVIEILDNSLVSNFSMKERMFFVLAKNRLSILFHITGLILGDVKRMISRLVK